MKQQNNNIEELFKDKLHNLEADPGANAWANVQSGISSGAASSSVTAAASSWASSAIVGVIITAVAIGGFFFFNNEGEKKIQPNQKTVETPKINPEVEEAVKQQKVSSAVENNNDVPTTDKSEIAHKTAASKKTLVKKDQSLDNKKNNTEIDAQIDEATQIIEEKTIDEILAEHQQFLDEQAAARKNAKSSMDNTAQSGSKEQQNDTKTTDPEVTKSSNPTNIRAEEKVNLIKEQKRIADQVIFPNVFSPGLDGYNDVFRMTVAKSLPIDNIEVSIIDLNGKVVGAYTGVYEGWDGRFLNGSFAPEGFYIYQAIIYVDGKQIPKVDSFSLKR